MILKLTALALTAIALIPSGAHFFELPGKMRLDRDAYFIVQGIYAGWALFVVPIVAAIIANFLLFLAERRRDAVSARAALVSGALILLSLVVFFIWVFPGNQATANWTQIPVDWEDLRRSWEYGHAANAVILLAALLATGRSIAGSKD